MKMVRGEYIYRFKDGTEWVVPNLITHEGLNTIAQVFAGQLPQNGTWYVGLASGAVSQYDTAASKTWVEPLPTTGYARQQTTVSGVVQTTVSNLDVACIEFNPVTFSCGAEDEVWDVACQYAWLGLQLPDEDTIRIISIGSKQPSNIRLVPGASFELAYRQYFG